MSNTLKNAKLKLFIQLRKWKTAQCAHCNPNHNNYHYKFNFFSKFEELWA